MYPKSFILLHTGTIWPYTFVVMKLLIFYSSNSGSTYTVARILESVLTQGREHPQVVLRNSKECTADDVQSADYIVAGTPSWFVDNKEGQPHEDVTALLEQINKLDLGNKYFSVFGCGDRSYLNFCNAVEIVKESLLKTGATLLMEPLKIDSFFFDQETNESISETWAKELIARLPTASLY